MANKLTRDTLVGDLGAITALIASVEGRDPIGERSLKRRRDEIVRQLASLDAESRTLASVALVFDGGPVRGSYGIDADFAGKALQDYQELVAKDLAASETGGLARRGPVPDKQRSRMNVTSVVHGSFGFVLEEDHSDEPQLIDSALRESVERVTGLLMDVAAPEAQRFNEVLERVDTRLFQTLKRFFNTLHKERSTMKIIDDEREVLLDQVSIERAHNRIEQAEVDETEISVTGSLLGLVPIQRRFDFLDTTTGAVIKGKVGEKLSAQYLERISNDEALAGKVWRAVMVRRTVRKPDRRETVEFTLIDLVEPKLGN